MTFQLKQLTSATLRWSPNTRLAWGLLIVMALMAMSGLKITGISLAPGTLPGIGIPITGLLILSFVYTHIRDDRRIAALAHMAAITLAFTTLAAILSYIVVRWERPLVDSYLVWADQTIGLRWLPLWQWVFDHPYLHMTLMLIYSTLIPQMILLLVILNFKGRINRSWELLWLFIISCIFCLIGSAVWPAIGTFGYFHVEPNVPYLGVYQELRHGTLKIIGHDTVEGIITFSSLHAALAIIFAYCARGIRILFPVLLVLNILVFLSTPFIGGHHFADLLGGAILTLITIYMVGLLNRSGVLPSD